jgi:AbrB family looped-hinge helix DNA binding protein
MHMETTRLSSKGQIILPKAVRDSRRWSPGTEFVVEERRDGVLLRPLKRVPPSRLDQVAGCLAEPGQRARTLDEMDRAVDDEIKARRDRGRY